jgi:hypothetical protein
MITRVPENSPRTKARAAGLLYLIIFVTAAFSEFFVRGKLLVHGDAAATATNILSQEFLYRLGGASQIIALVCDVAVAVIFYDLFKPVNRRVSLAAALFRITFVGIMGFNMVNHFAPLVLLRGGHALTSFNTDQLEALAFASQRLYGTGYVVSTVFFGFQCLLLGYVVFRSCFLPRVLGALLLLAGVGYVANAFAQLVAPAVADSISSYLLLPGVVGELSLTLWLLIGGVHVERWKARASATP